MFSFETLSKTQLRTFTKACGKGQVLKVFHAWRGFGDTLLPHLGRIEYCTIKQDNNCFKKQRNKKNTVTVTGRDACRICSC